MYDLLPYVSLTEKIIIKKIVISMYEYAIGFSKCCGMIDLLSDEHFF